MSTLLPNSAGPEAPAAYDAAIIGGGVVGCAVFRALTLGGLACVLLERSADILSGASKGNSAILHTAFDAPTGSLEHRLMQDGRRLYLDQHQAFGLPLTETDACLVAWTEAEAARLPAILAQAQANGVPGVAPVEIADLRRRFPGLGDGATAALHVPGEHVIDPWTAPLAYALQAIAHGGEVRRLFEVTGAHREGSVWRLVSGGRSLTAGLVVNCAGNHGDHVEALARPSPFRITPRKGQFVVYDKTARRHLPTILLPVPNERTKGVVVCPTVFGNVLVGPTAEDQQDRTRADTDRATLETLMAEGARMVPALADEPVTAIYAGLRPATEHKDYQIEPLPDLGWITVAGIRSTGLTAALGIGAHVAGLVDEHFRRLAAQPIRHWPALPRLSEDAPRDHQRPGRGDLVCQCELVTRDEIEAALSGPLPAGDLGGLKRRTRAMMGRCQGFNCLAAVCAQAEGRLLEAPPLADRTAHAS